MSFIAECTFCQGKVRVPNGALGLSVPCPRCGNNFTLAADTPRPEDPVMVDSAIKARKKAKAPLKTMTGPLMPALLTPKDASMPDGAVSEEYVKQILQTNRLQPGLLPAPEQETNEEASTQRRKVNYVGVASLLAGTMALLLAQVPALYFLVLPVSGAALLGGLAGFLVQGQLPKSGLVFSGAGTLVGGAVFLIACFAPDLLEMDLRRVPTHARVDRNRQQKVDLHGNTFQTVGASDWVLAGKGSFQHGVVRVRVVPEARFALSREEHVPSEDPQPRVYVKPIELKDAKGPLLSEKKYLAIYLRLINAGAASQVVYKSWGWAGQNSSAAPLLRDNIGRTYPLAALGSGLEVVGQRRRVLLLPGKPVVDVLVFEAPGVNTGHLRLELPASAFGGTGKLRFQIPGSMIEVR
jgi:hypothetical protein